MAITWVKAYPLRDEHAYLEIRRGILDQDLKPEYQEFLQEHNRNHADSDGRPGQGDIIGRPFSSSVAPRPLPGWR